MIWTEIPSNKIIASLEAEFMKIYPYNIDNEDNRLYFSLPDKSTMRIDRFGEGCVVMSYWSDFNEDICGDGDVFYVNDYKSLDDLFNAMLEETKR